MTTKSGYIGILGKPNVGKSTLLNQLLGTKISITSKKAQTTRQRILGIKTDNEIQAIYVDTPGIHSNYQKALNRFMVKTAIQSLSFVDIVIFVIDVRNFTEEDQHVLNHVKKLDLPMIIALNKIDKIDDKSALLPTIEYFQSIFQPHFSNIDFVPLSAKTGKNIESLEKLIQKFLPEGPHLFDSDQLTDKNSKFIFAEIIREKLLRLVGAEVPHEVAIEIETFKQQDQKHFDEIGAIIWVSRKGQKKIIIGKEGQILKQVGILARHDIEKFLGKQVMLRLWIKIRKNWSDDERALKSLGFYDE